MKQPKVLVHYERLFVRTEPTTSPAISYQNPMDMIAYLIYLTRLLSFTFHMKTKKKSTLILPKPVVRPRAPFNVEGRTLREPFFAPSRVPRIGGQPLNPQDQCHRAQTFNQDPATL